MAACSFSLADIETGHVAHFPVHLSPTDYPPVPDISTSPPLASILLHQLPTKELTMLDSRFNTLPLLTDICATLNPGGFTARVDLISQTGMTLRYITIDETTPPNIQGIILLVDGYVQTLVKGDFTVIKDQELKNSRSNGFRLRKIEVRFLRGG